MCIHIAIKILKIRSRRMRTYGGKQKHDITICTYIIHKYYYMYAYIYYKTLASQFYSRQTSPCEFIIC